MDFRKSSALRRADGGRCSSFIAARTARKERVSFNTLTRSWTRTSRCIIGRPQPGRDQGSGRPREIASAVVVWFVDLHPTDYELSWHSAKRSDAHRRIELPRSRSQRAGVLEFPGNGSPPRHVCFRRRARPLFAFCVTEWAARSTWDLTQACLAERAPRVRAAKSALKNPAQKWSEH